MMTNNALNTPFKVIIGQHIRVRGIVQGVGFRPFVWHLAKQFGITGHIFNDGDGVSITAWSHAKTLEKFVSAISQQAPPLARIDSINIKQHTNQTPKATQLGFQIIDSQVTHSNTQIVADTATCSHCLSDSTAPSNRRLGYPFTNCTHCGPRLSIIRAIPYDRANTSMSHFTLCPTCQAEYDSPADRRFHAQPNACPDCGPKVWLHPNIKQSEDDALLNASKLLTQGHIIAIKGIGGFHLACDATNNNAVERLRQRKQRYAKPFALMAKNSDMIRQHCHVSADEEALLNSPQAPVVLLKKRNNHCLASSVAKQHSVFGFMLPYSPLHHLLFASLNVPIVMTSGNKSGNPQAINNDEALKQLSPIADYFILHNRDIVNRIDDSVARIVRHKTQLLRRARGFAPASLSLPHGFDGNTDLLALGGELKNTFCLIKGKQAILSQHMGDLENASTYDDYLHHLSLYQQLFEHQPRALVIDPHPEYLSTKLGKARAEKEHLSLIEVQHHHAHIAACLCENQWPLHAGKVLGIALDGLGYGTDNTLWGGEFLIADYHQAQRVAHLKPIAMLGNQQATLQPWRNTYAQLCHALDWQTLQQQYPKLELVQFLRAKPLATFDAMMAKNLNAPKASSCGRLFDAVAAAIGICREHVHYEGQAALELEALVTPQLLLEQAQQAYRFDINDTQQPCIIETKPIWLDLLNDLDNGCEPAIIATRFHLGLAHALVAMVQHITTQHSFQSVALSGGVFQNLVLLQLVTQQLSALNYNVLTHSQVPANDGGLALGQAVVALAQTINPQENMPCV